MITMRDMHRLAPCALCSIRMAVPGGAICTICDAVTLPGLVPDDLSTMPPLAGAA